MCLAHLLTGLDTAMLMAPFFVFLVIWMFGLDQRVAAPKVRVPRRAFCPPDGNVEAHFSDPDGTPWPRRPAKIRPAEN